MRNNLKTVLLLIICGLLGYHVYFAIQKRIPCAEPLTYALGTFDGDFNISQEYFLSALKEAEDIWEVPYGKDLFTYDSTENQNTKRDVLTVNLIYDYRQEATSKLKSLGGVVEENQATYDSLEIKFKALKSRYETAEGALNVRIATFNKKNKEYEDQVTYWNKRGGAPEKEYTELQAEGKRLNQEMKDIQAEQDRVEGMINEINTQVVTLNKLADTLNITVKNYNTTNTARGESFEEGLYVTDGQYAHIDIYEFSSRKKLVRVLAHELGHALGIEHVPDPSAIMYEFNKGEQMKLTADDANALKVVCKDE